MPYVVTLENFQPSPRHDEVPWTQARIEESASELGIYTALETFTLDPVDPDPRQPLERDFTTSLATLADGWYRVAFIDDSGAEETSPAVHKGPGPAWAPTLSDVAGHLNAALVDDGGNPIEIWTSTTTPAAVEVQPKLDRAARDVRRDIGSALRTITDDDVIASARDLAALRAALYVQEAFYPEQADDAAAVYPLLKRLYDEGVTSLRRATRRAASVTLESPYSGGDDDITELLL